MSKSSITTPTVHHRSVVYDQRENRRKGVGKGIPKMLNQRPFPVFVLLTIYDGTLNLLVYSLKCTINGLWWWTSNNSRSVMKDCSLLGSIVTKKFSFANFR